MNSETRDSVADALLRLKFERPIVFFDLETTGVDIAKDRIVSISCLKIFPTGEVEERDIFVNPNMLIPASATEVHGITDEMVKDKPQFRQIAVGLRDFISGCDLAGFNSNNFDIPLLAEEYARLDMHCPEERTQFLDVFAIFRKMEPRDLTAAVKFYLGEDHANAHRSLDDIKATFRVFAQQLVHYPDLTDKSLKELCDLTEEKKRLDFAGHIGIDADGDYIYNTGKQKGSKIKNDTGFANWMLSQSHYTLTTKATVRRVLQEIRNPQQSPTLL